MNQLDELLKLIEDCLPHDETGNSLAFTRSIPVKEAITKSYLTKEQVEE
jgi:hypothetical protein